MAELGFIGLGIMGKPMAGHLLRAGHNLYVYNRSPRSAEALQRQGAVLCASAREVAKRAPLLFIMVPDTPDVEAVLFGKDGVAEGIEAGSIVVDMSSISPIATKEFAMKLKALGVEMLDAPVSGGQVGAENATLSIMVGGDEAVFSKVRPYFEQLGKNIVLVGGNGDGQTCKVANQIVVALTIEAVGEALLFAAKAGADPAKVRQALLGGFAHSRVLEVHGEKMLKRSFQPGFKICLQQKDLNLALDAARKMGLYLPHTATTQALFNSLAAHDCGDLDHSALVLALERMANHAIA